MREGGGGRRRGGRKASVKRVCDLNSKGEMGEGVPKTVNWATDHT